LFTEFFFKNYDIKKAFYILPIQTQNMSKKEDLDLLRKYRDSVESDIIEAEKDYNTTITYVAAGALGLLLTINEKFFHITEAKDRTFLFLSIIFLLLTLVLLIVNTIISFRSNSAIRELADTMLEKGVYDQEALTKAYRMYFKISRFFSYLRFVLLIAGIIFEIVFITQNIFTNHTPEKTNPPKTLKIDIKNPRDSNSVSIDSTYNQVNIIIKTSN
jgi:hypothetical protein